MSSMSNSSDSENGLLSFSNPNYQLEPPDVNSNLDTFDDYEDLYEEFDTVCSTQQRKSSIKSRRNYAKLDPASMGVTEDHETSPLLSADYENNLKENSLTTTFEGKVYHKVDNSPNAVDSNDNKDFGHVGFLDYYINLEPALKQVKDSSNIQSYNCSNNSLNCHASSADSKEREMTIESEQISVVQNSGIQTYAETEPHNSLERKNHQKDQQMPSLCNIPKKHSTNHINKSIPLETEILPSGWEKHEDESGPYYWHISSGTIQREPPPPSCNTACKLPAQISKGIDMISSISDFSLNSKNMCSCTRSVISEPACSKSASSAVKNELKRKSFPEGSCSITVDKRPVRFAVRSLGWVEIAEDDLTPEKSSKAVNKCIVDLSMGRNDILDVVGRWGDGKDLYMDLDDYSLRLTDTQDMTVLNTQPIHTIRVWGVGRDNGRDFAYVARDRVTRKYMCHVFRCDIPARIIANTLRDICKKIMIERSLQQNLAKQVVPGQIANGNGSMVTLGIPARPTNFPIEQQCFLKRDGSSSYMAQSFPTPMEEPKKVLKVHYVGTMSVGKATGVDVLNDAIEQLSNEIPPSDYRFVNVAVAPSTITISEHGDNGKVIEECRVRFLSFLGIGKNIKHCGFIVHTAQDQFVAHVFYCEPSSGALCKTIEAACKLRYQKCLDAHRKINEKRYSDAVGNKGLATTIRSILGSIGRLAKTVDT